MEKVIDKISNQYADAFSNHFEISNPEDGVLIEHFPKTFEGADPLVKISGVPWQGTVVKHDGEKKELTGEIFVTINESGQILDIEAFMVDHDADSITPDDHGIISSDSFNNLMEQVKGMKESV